MTVEQELLTSASPPDPPPATDATSPPELAPATGMQSVRVDRWLWAARFFKTRSQANKACAAGHVKVNEVSVKAAKLVRPGDEVDVVTLGGRRLVDVLALAEKRGPAKVAQALYNDRTPPAPPDDPSFATRDRGTGRPEKRDRRLLIRLRGR